MCVCIVHVYIPEHLKSRSLKSAMLCPFKWLGEWHRVYGDKLGDECKKSNSHARWQSQANGLSDNLNARNRGIPVKISRGMVVMLLLLSVLHVFFKVNKIKRQKEREYSLFWIVFFCQCFLNIYIFLNKIRRFQRGLTYPVTFF